MRFTVLASGSSGNASLLEIGGCGLLLDFGLGPCRLVDRLAAASCSLSRVNAVLLTHTHSDHWKERTLVHLLSKRIPLYCHAQHQEWLLEYSSAFADMQTEGLVHCYAEDRELWLTPLLRCLPFEVSHDEPTYGFRFEAALDDGTDFCSLGYAADLGTWGRQQAHALADVDLLALEFNHDVAMQRESGRSPSLIRRVLGNQGHLSNEQAAGLLGEVLRLSTPGRLRHVVQLHLSRDCNRPALAVKAAREILRQQGHDIKVHTASQHQVGPSLHLGKGRRATKTASHRLKRFKQPVLPGFE